MADTRRWLDSAGQAIQFDKEAHMSTNRQLFVILPSRISTGASSSSQSSDSRSRKVSPTRRQGAW